MDLRTKQAEIMRQVNWRKARINKGNVDGLGAIYEVSMLLAKKALHLTLGTGWLYYEERYRKTLEETWKDLCDGKFEEMGLTRELEV